MLPLRRKRVDCNHGDRPLRANEAGVRLQIAWRHPRRDDKERIGWRPGRRLWADTPGLDWRIHHCPRSSPGETL